MCMILQKFNSWNTHEPWENIIIMIDKTDMNNVSPKYANLNPPIYCLIDMITKQNDWEYGKVKSLRVTKLGIMLQLKMDVLHKKQQNVNQYFDPILEEGIS